MSGGAQGQKQIRSVHYFVQQPGGGQSGPWTFQELRSLAQRGGLDPDSMVRSELEGEWFPYKDLVASAARRSGEVEGASEFIGSKDRLVRDEDGLRRWTAHVLIPWAELKSGAWLKQRRAFLIAGVGLFPMAILAFFGDSQDLHQAYWAVAFYFSLLWAGFFYQAFPVIGVRKKDAGYCLFGSAICCTLLLWLIYSLTPAKVLEAWITSPMLLKAWIGFVGGVGVPEELAKALILILMFREKDRIHPHTMLFYGLMAGLGFGLYEGVRYQFHWNWQLTRTPEGYYLLNLLRLTSLPFLHAVWGGIAGHFLGYSLWYPKHRMVLVLAAIGIPAVLHGTYDLFSQHLFGLCVAAFSVLALNLYLARGMELERELPLDRSIRGS